MRDALEGGSRRLVRDGGLWVDTDTIALRPFVFPEDRLVLGRQDARLLNNAVLGAPPGRPLIRQLQRTASRPDCGIR
jgi:hypothetical protein